MTLWGGHLGEAILRGWHLSWSLNEMPVGLPKALAYPPYLEALWHLHRKWLLPLFLLQRKCLYILWIFIIFMMQKFLSPLVCSGPHLGCHTALLSVQTPTLTYLSSPLLWCSFCPPHFPTSDLALPHRLDLYYWQPGHKPGCSEQLQFSMQVSSPPTLTLHPLAYGCPLTDHSLTYKTQTILLNAYDKNSKILHPSPTENVRSTMAEPVSPSNEAVLLTQSSRIHL